MSKKDELKDDRIKNLITDPDEIVSILNSGNQKHINEAQKRMKEQARRALSELQMQMVDLVSQVLGFTPTPEQRRKHGKVEHRRHGGLVMYWNGTPFLKLSRVMAKKKLMRVGEEKEKIQFYQDYEILKDDPTGYKKKNPTDNYEANNYPDDVTIN